MKAAAEVHGRVFPASALLIDLDGTLVDTAPDLADAANRMLADLGRAPFPESTVASWIGNGVPRLVRRALTGSRDGEPDPALFERGYARFLEHYRSHVADRSRPFPGTIETLERLQADGYRLACVTNKAEMFTTPLLAALDLDRYFDLVVSGDSLPRCKPDPMPLYHACQVLGVPVTQGLAVGDSESDVKAAQAAGMPVICVAHGYHQGVDLQSLAPDRVISGLPELPACVRRA